MNLRDYNEAVKCLDEAESLLGEKIPDIHFRRSQARLYNKDSSYEELLLALKDINKVTANIKNENDKEDYIKQLNLTREKIESKKEDITKIIKSNY